MGQYAVAAGSRRAVDKIRSDTTEINTPSYFRLDKADALNNTASKNLRVKGATILSEHFLAIFVSRNCKKNKSVSVDFHQRESGVSKKYLR